MSIATSRFWGPVDWMHAHNDVSSTNDAKENGNGGKSWCESGAIALPFQMRRECPETVLSIGHPHTCLESAQS